MPATEMTPALTAITVLATDGEGLRAPLTQTIVSMVLRHLGLVPAADLNIAEGSQAAHLDVAHFNRLTYGHATVRCCGLAVSITQDASDGEPAWA
jgi:hypothetical protein